ncbi:hypothetical protein [Coralliovum pocilloporae]|uniref:hypothetical protein n=1 Tax=Coralliovum pocilloporae TaxID=3066369 RepID=UPI0033076242
MSHQSTSAQAASLLALRVTIGMLLVWWGLARIVNPDMGVAVSAKFYLDVFSLDALQYYFGFAQVLIGLCVVVGFKRTYTVPAQFLITGLSSLSIWQALLDPFGFYLPLEKISEVQHLFYPSAVIIAGSLTLIAFKSMDRWALDRWLGQHSA